MNQYAEAIRVAKIRKIDKNFPDKSEIKIDTYAEDEMTGILYCNDFTAKPHPQTEHQEGYVTLMLKGNNGITFGAIYVNRIDVMCHDDSNKEITLGVFDELDIPETAREVFKLALKKGGDKGQEQTTTEEASTKQ